MFTMERDDRKTMKDSFDPPEPQSDTTLQSLFVSDQESPIPKYQQVQSLRVFVATWNVGGKSPHSGLDMDEFLQVHDQSDIYVLGFQEIVPLNAGNVLVNEDNEPAAKWLTLISQSLNKFCNATSKGDKPSATLGISLFFQKSSLRKISKPFRMVSKKRLKSCNCTFELERKLSKDFCFSCQLSNVRKDDFSSDVDDDAPNSFFAHSNNANQMMYSLIASKQMVGIFVTVWARRELAQNIGHMRISSISRGIMGCLGNKGCISVSMTIHQTSFCFVCSHLASGEKEGDEFRRNLDVIETLKSTEFPNICKALCNNVPEKILDHDRIIWFGDLNYRIALSYSDTRKLLGYFDWDTLLNNDQLKIEREAGRVFKGWREGKIYFPPTYKYLHNSDTYAGETTTRKKNRRTPAWCDRILWHGNGIQQISYIRGESRFSDHRPVCATFFVDVDIIVNESKKGLSGSNMKVGIEELLVPAAASIYFP